MLPADSPFASPPAPGPHPAPAALRAYAAGTLSAADEHQIEAHSLDCERCAELLTGFSMSDQATTDQALTSLRIRLQARVAHEAPAAPAPLPASRPLWPRLAAAAALLGVVAGSIWGWEKYEHPTPATARLETTAPPAPNAASKATPEAASTPEIAMAPRSAASATSAEMPPPPPPSAHRSINYAARSSRPVASPQLNETMPPASPPAADAPYQSERVVAGRAADAVLSNASAEAEATVVPPVAGTPAAPTLAISTAPPDSLTPPILASAKMSRQLAKAKSTINARTTDNTARVAAVPLTAAPGINPVPVGGTKALREYLRRGAIAFVLEDGASGLSGLVHLRFTVGADGKLSDLTVVRGLRADYDAEALRLIKEGPAWQPGVAGGRRAPLTAEVTVPF